MLLEFYFIVYIIILIRVNVISLVLSFKESF